MNAFGLAPLLLIFPVIGVLFNGLVGRRFVEADRKTGEKWTGWFGTMMAFGAFLTAVALFLSLQANHYHVEIIHLFNWLDIPSANFTVPWAMRVDTLSVTMMLVVTGVGSLIHIYAIGYMHGDQDFSRFFAYLNLFLFFMLILVSGSSYLMLFVGWEGVGLCSFLLIGFWFDRVDKNGVWKNANAARKAFVVNRVGDFGMILAIILTFWAFGSLEFDPVFETALEMFESAEPLFLFGQEIAFGTVITAITALFLLGATGKSAQIPLYVWLPDAMAGPTPVSALIHAATMVTSGIYLIVRSNVLFEIARLSVGDQMLFGIITTPDLVAIVGASTALIAGLIAFTQFDIKGVLAYSTISQLGFMIAAVGMGAYVAGTFHLIMHAFFKALLFMSAGSVIHGMEHGHHNVHGHDDAHAGENGSHHEEEFDPQDMRTMGGLRHRMKITSVVYIIGALALSGIVPLAGFWSKDEILAHANTNMGDGWIFTAVYVMLVLAAVCTAFYMGRQLRMVFFNAPRHEAAAHAEESSNLMTYPLIVLAALAVFGGLMNSPHLVEQAVAHGEEVVAHGEEVAEASGFSYLALEHWLEHSLGAFELTKEQVLHMPHTPTNIQPFIAISSTILAVLSISAAFFWVYGKKPETAKDPDPLQKTPIWWFSVLPLNTLYFKYFVPAFNRMAKWMAFSLDWTFWHDFVHDRLIRDMFVAFAAFTSSVLDQKGVDGIVNGAASTTRQLAGLLRRTENGYVRSYALTIFMGAVLLVIYFLFTTAG